ncbi:MAG: hypothetical protein Q7S15_00295 [bacterium]|nr:hypothetical protein [bacterium]
MTFHHTLIIINDWTHQGVLFEKEHVVANGSNGHNGKVDPTHYKPRRRNWSARKQARLIRGKGTLARRKFHEESDLEIQAFMSR